jgi:Fe-S cluster assembly protein SufB
MATETIETVGTADTPNREIHEQLGRKYEAGFVTDIESDSFLPGLNEDVIRALSAKKEEPEWMTQWRLEAYRHFLTMQQPDWAKLQIGPIDLQALSYYSAPKGPKYKSLDEVPKELLDTYDKLGGGCGVRLGLGRHHLPQGAGREGRDLLLDLRSHP